MKLKICTCFVLTIVLGLSCLAGCVGFDGPNGNGSFTPYEESLRVEDTRRLTPQEYSALNIVGEDDFGRTIVSVDGKENDERYVGMFFFLSKGEDAESKKGIYDVSKITENGEHDEYFQVNNTSSPVGAGHFWGEPVWGYYHSEDEWVLRKQIEMLTIIGIDFLIFDVSNAFTYTSVTDILFPIMLEYQTAGWNVPKVMYYVAYDAGNGEYMTTLKEVYNYFYKDETYQSLWFCPNGKPIITMHENYYWFANNYYNFNMNDPTEAAMYNLFEFKCRNWPNQLNEDNSVPWMDWEYPQTNYNGWMSVSVAQHPTSHFSDTVGTNGRGYNVVTGVNDHSKYLEDINYISQWQTVLDANDNESSKDVDFVFLTGWNEWIATKFYSLDLGYYMVDTYNAEFSRDIEPSVNNGDNTYLLTAQKLREYNYSEARHYTYPSTTIDINGDDEVWSGVTATYADFTNDCLDRNHRAMAGSTKYTDTSGRNDIARISVARDGTYLYFRVETVDTITQYESGDTTWMNIWIKTQNAETTCNGYNYVINRSVSGNTTTVSKAASSSSWKSAGTGDVRLYGNVMIVRVKLSVLGLGGSNYDIEFKVSDHVTDSGDYLDFYRTGDAAPIGRLNYKYGY